MRNLALLVFVALLSTAATAQGPTAAAPDFSPERLRMMFHEQGPAAMSDTSPVQWQTAWGNLRFVPLVLSSPLGPTRGVIFPMVTPFMLMNTTFPDASGRGFFPYDSPYPGDVRLLMQQMDAKKARDNQKRRVSLTVSTSQ